MVRENPTVPEIPGSWNRCEISMLSSAVWEDHRAAREGFSPGIVIAVPQRTPDGYQILRITRTDRYDREAFAVLLGKIVDDSMDLNVTFS